jgi:choice-of-anchor A domain-containing protein
MKTFNLSIIFANRNLFGNLRKGGDRLCLVFCLAVALLTLSQVRADVEGTSAVQFFGISSAYNNVIFGDFTGGYARTGTAATAKTGGDIEGHAAIQGDVKVRNFGFGSGQMGLHADNRNVLVVGGNVTASSSDVYDGNAYVAGRVVANSDVTSSKWNVLGTSNNRIDAYNKLTPDYEATAGKIYTRDFNPGTDYYAEDGTGKRVTESWSEAGISSLPFDFTVAKEQLTQVSSDLWNNKSTVVGDYIYDTSVPWERVLGYEIDLTGLSGLQTVTVDASVFNNLVVNQSGFLNILTDPNADLTLIINVSDDNNLGFLNLAKEFYINGENNRDEINDYFNGSNILINTADSISQITAVNAEINASILALNETIEVNSGNISCQVFSAGADLYNGGEFHAYYTFDDKHMSVATPEPATALIFGIALAAAPFARRFRRK